MSNETIENPKNHYEVVFTKKIGEQSYTTKRLVFCSPTLGVSHKTISETIDSFETEGWLVSGISRLYEEPEKVDIKIDDEEIENEVEVYQFNSICSIIGSFYRCSRF
jgi:hypothetical protein